MPTYKVSKNIESEPLIYGVKTKYFYKLITFLGIGAIGILVIGFMMFSSLVLGVILLICYLFVFGTFFLIAWNFYAKKSRQDKYRFSNKTIRITNRNLPSQL